MVAEIAVLGAGGGTGQKCVERLLEQHKGVKAVVRDAAKYKQVWPNDDNLSLINGDVTDAASIEAALEGVKGIIFAVSASSYFSANAVDRDVSLLLHLLADAVIQWAQYCLTATSILARLRGLSGMGDHALIRRLLLLAMK